MGRRLSAQQFLSFLFRKSQSYRVLHISSLHKKDQHCMYKGMPLKIIFFPFAFYANFSRQAPIFPSCCLVCKYLTLLNHCLFSFLLSFFFHIFSFPFPYPPFIFAAKGNRYSSGWPYPSRELESSISVKGFSSFHILLVILLWIRVIGF